MPFFDHNATTPLLPAARTAWLEAVDAAWQNPSSPYRASARVHRLLEEARGRAAELLGGAASEIVFTSGATEANNAVLAWGSHRLPGEAVAAVSPTEHPSVLEAARAWWGERLRLLEVDGSGQVRPDALESIARRERVALVAHMAANNETGVLGRVHETARWCERNGAALLCDASQWIGRLPALDLPGAAFLVGCAHKFGGPKGVGVLRVPPGVSGLHLQYGGAQEEERRGGTENYPAIAAMVAAWQWTETQDAAARTSRGRWRDAFLEQLGEAIPGIRVHGEAADRLWNTVSLGLPAHANSRWVTLLDRRECQVSTGSACATGSDAPSHVLAAMGCGADLAGRTIRISAGWETTPADWSLLVDAMAQTWRQLETESDDTVVIAP